MRARAPAVAVVYVAWAVAAHAEASPIDPLAVRPTDEQKLEELEALEHVEPAPNTIAPWVRWRVHPSATYTRAPGTEAAVEWTHDPPVDVSVASLDHLRVESRWNLSQLNGNAEDEEVVWELCAVRDDGESISVASGAAIAEVLASTSLGHDGESEESDTEVEPGNVNEAGGGLECEFDTAYCVPELISIRLPDMKEGSERGEHGDASVLSVNHSIVLEFSQPTNRPNASTVDEIGAIVDISDYVGDNLTGSWSSDGRVLTLTVLEIAESKVKPARELLAGLVNTKVRYKTASRGGSSNPPDPKDTKLLVTYSLALSFRIERAGTYFVRITRDVSGSEDSATQATDIFRSPAFTVRAKDESHVVLVDNSRTNPTISTGHTHHEELRVPDLDDPSLTRPSLFIPGTLSYGGDEGFVIPESAIQPNDSPHIGSWSLSFWTFLTEDATGDFRTLFFHGDGALEQRTPSAWWKPDERRLVLRVSTATDPDVGLDSGRTLPLREWVHLGFSFHNCTDTALEEDSACPAPGGYDGASWQYVVEFYVNGVLDQRVRVHDHVARNLGPLHIGKGPWAPGMQGFTSNLRVFSSAVSGEQHRLRFLFERGFHPSYRALPEATNAVHAIEEAAKLPTSQIAYLYQQLMAGVRSSNNAEDEQVQALAAQCDARALDRLRELAEQGNAAALGRVGASVLYGAWMDVTDASDCAPVSPSASEAASLLLRAVRGGNVSAARYLALALEILSAGGQADADLDELTRGLLPFKLGLYHAAAAVGSKAAFALLGNAYRNQGDALVAAAAHHYFHAARDASVAFHERGKQPLHEMDRLYDFVDSEGREDLTARGQRGEDDELIQLQQMRADQHGDVEAMAAMGDLYYWGARGVPRDHERAFRYFKRAADAGNANAQCAVANMLLRGEGGVQQNNETAIAWYERAAESENHPRALNGLGFMLFHGSAGLEENKTRALELFERAASEQRDGDSLFNAGYCYAKGIGTTGGRANTTRAIELFDVAARKFGHFDSVMELAEIWMRGVSIRQTISAGDGSPAAVAETKETVDADWKRALPYVKAAADAGRWGSKMRAGFSYFVDRDWIRAIVQYHDADAFGGYSLATSNLAFLYDALLAHDGDSDASFKRRREQRSLEYLLRAHEQNGDREVLVRIGDFHFQGLAGLHADSREALAWYSRASARGDDRGAYNVGCMYEYGVGGVDVNLPRARRYYERAAELAAETNRGQFASIPARLALLRVAAREWVRGIPMLEALADWLSTMQSGGPRFDGVQTLDHQEHSVANLGTVVGATAIAGVILTVLARRQLQFLRPTS